MRSHIRPGHYFGSTTAGNGWGFFIAMETQKNRVGRPMKFKSVKALQEKIDAYFNETPLHEQTITGMALFLDTTRETLCDYQVKDKYSDIIKKAKLRVEHACELVGVERGRPFDIFRLKQLGWTDKQENDVRLSADADFLSALRDSGRMRG